MRVFADIDELRGAVGQVLGESEWVTVTQAMIDKFADATGDHQWIHVDVERARKSPFGNTIAHGFLTLSLLPQMLYSIYSVGKIAASLNYGCNRVRFTAPVPSGSRVKGRIKLLNVETIERGVRVTNEATMALEGSERPACVAELMAVFIPS